MPGPSRHGAAAGNDALPCLGRLHPVACILPRWLARMRGDEVVGGRGGPGVLALLAQPLARGQRQLEVKLPQLLVLDRRGHRAAAHRKVTDRAEAAVGPEV